jgi:hypothetical protein
LTEKNNALSRHLNYYKKKSQTDKELKKLESIPLEEAIIQAVNLVLESNQRYKIMSNKTKASSIARAVFNDSFAHGLAKNEIIREAKVWLRKNVFTSVEILRQMDLRGGTLNYEGLSVMNDVETAAYKGDLKCIKDRVIPTPACLKRVAEVVEKEGDKICPFKMISTPFGEGVKFDYAKATRLVINGFDLESVGMSRYVNLSASIDAAHMTKSICHTSAGFKMSDPLGKNPLRQMRACR